MKPTVIALVLVAGTMAPLTATAGGEDLAQKAGCLMCHAVDTKKMGPAFKEIAVKHKGQSEAAFFADWKGVKTHSAVKASDADVKAVLNWVLTLK